LLCGMPQALFCFFRKTLVLLLFLWILLTCVLSTLLFWEGK
jgi:hypothetical protein